ncbi:hypothetical protein GCM10025868_29060 [Angustibacter aerolatus]|uniref:O-acetylhomoserine aminocarboxypropyltransferase/cysteine synthase n=1 Tax=Angustibacter aerolatus TaxID=1162965 RepID=A0ABQ6JHF1_9ACTN|nr:PLP-dependent transferase [Angustibacter aerolatus]GMA87656.1 hypothetical protein GCM10025868_29060 [Angustibacter aerolatus]
MPCTPAARRTRRRAPGRCRSTRRAGFVFDDTDDAANLFALQKYGSIYSRIGNPTVAAFEERMASLEGGLGAVAAASGLAAEFLVFAALAGAGDHIVAAGSLYGGTLTQARRHAAPVRGRDDVRARHRPGRLRGGDHRPHQVRVRRGGVEPER